MTSEPGRTIGVQRITLWRRLALLATCLGLGFTIGWLGWRFSADDRWFLALPIVLVLGWLAVADPSQCTPVRERSDEGGAPR